MHTARPLHSPHVYGPFWHVVIVYFVLCSVSLHTPFFFLLYAVFPPLTFQQQTINNIGIFFAILTEAIVLQQSVLTD